MTIDLRTCHKGDPLKLRCGEAAEYAALLAPGDSFPHHIKRGESYARYTDTGGFYASCESPLDVVEILPRKPVPKPKPAMTRDVRRVLSAATSLALRLRGGKGDLREKDDKLKCAVDLYQRAEKRRKAKK